MGGNVVPFGAPAAAAGPRGFDLPIDEVTFLEQRVMAAKFGVNYDALIYELRLLPKPDDWNAPTEAERIAWNRGFVRVIGPIERFALLHIAVKRVIPSATDEEIERRADRGDWYLGRIDGGPHHGS